jgi:hypothetical protein
VVTAAPVPADRFPGDALITGWEPESVSGRGRVAALTVQRADQRYTLDCDAVILAAGARPLRNIDGAVTAPADGVTFVQPAADTGSWERVAAAARAAAARLAAESEPASPAEPDHVRRTEAGR